MVCFAISQSVKCLDQLFLTLGAYLFNIFFVYFRPLIKLRLPHLVAS